MPERDAALAGTSTAEPRRSSAAMRDQQWHVGSRRCSSCLNGPRRASARDDRFSSKAVVRRADALPLHLPRSESERPCEAALSLLVQSSSATSRALLLLLPPSGSGSCASRRRERSLRSKAAELPGRLGLTGSFSLLPPREADGVFSKARLTGVPPTQRAIVRSGLRTGHSHEGPRRRPCTPRTPTLAAARRSRAVRHRTSLAFPPRVRALRGSSATKMAAPLPRHPARSAAGAAHFGGGPRA
jgi:hypothetical protein